MPDSRPPFPRRFKIATIVFGLVWVGLVAIFALTHIVHPADVNGEFRESAENMWDRLKYSIAAIPACFIFLTFGGCWLMAAIRNRN